MRKVIVTFIIFINSIGLSFAQSNCTTCTGTQVSGSFPSAIGYYTKATADYSFAAGYMSEASEKTAIALGWKAKATGLQSISIGESSSSGSQAYSFGQSALALAQQSLAIGRFVKTDATYGIGSIVIGSSISGKELINNVGNSLMIGFNSTVPTFFVGASASFTGIGKVGIGTSSPSTNLHILSNTGENALLYVQTKQFTGTAYAGFLLGNQSHGLTADPTNGLMFRTQKYYIFNDGNVGIGTSTPLTKLQVTGTSMFDKVGIGTSNPLADLQVNGSVSIGYETALATQAKSLIVSGAIGIGTFAPTARLDVVGKIKAETLQLTTSFNTGYILMSDFQGNASWTDPATANVGAWTKNGNNIFVGSDKKVGIGIETPSEPLHVAGNVLITGAIKGGHNDWQSLNLYGNSSETDGARIMIGNSSAANGGFIKMFAVGTTGKIEFSNQNMVVMAIKANNDIVIGNATQPSNMFVNGEITTNLVRVNTQEWYDCVFEKDYKLQPLSEVEAYINQYKHLPEIPSEAEVKADGIDVAQMNALLLKKVEELTLYVIELEKRVNGLSK